MTEALIAIVSLIIGTILNEFAATFRESRQTWDRNKSVRTIVAVEMVYNVDLIRALVNPILSIKDSMEDYSKSIGYRDVENDRRRLAKTLLLHPSPTFRYIGLESQMSYLADALNPEQITEIFSFYDKLRYLQDIRQELEELERLEHEFANAAKGFPRVDDRFIAGPDPSRPFYERAPRLWKLYEQIYSDLLHIRIPFEYESIVARRKRTKGKP